MYDARLISNYILTRHSAAEFSISNKKLNKILYFLHGHYIATKGARLIENPFEAWRHGPVCRVVYDEFKKFGASPIKDLAIYFDYCLGREAIADPNCIAPSDRSWIDDILRRYISLSANQLELTSHEMGSPWWEVYHGAAQNPLGRIPDALTEKYFGNF